MDLQFDLQSDQERNATVQQHSSKSTSVGSGLLGLFITSAQRRLKVSLEFFHNRGILVEELYKRPNWREFIKVANEKDDLRKKLLRMSASDLADILVKLDRM